jgi:hypothetical protein
MTSSFNTDSKHLSLFMLGGEQSTVTGYSALHARHSITFRNAVISPKRSGIFSSILRSNTHRFRSDHRINMPQMEGCRLRKPIPLPFLRPSIQTPHPLSCFAVRVSCFYNNFILARLVDSSYPLGEQGLSRQHYHARP